MSSLSIIFLLIVLLITAFASAQALISFPHDDLDSSSLDLFGNAEVSDGILTLDGRLSPGATALYKKPISPAVDSSGSSNLAFSSFFIFSSNSIDNVFGSFRFVIRSNLPNANTSTVSSTTRFGVGFNYLIGYEVLPPVVYFDVYFFALVNDTYNTFTDTQPAVNKSYQQACSADSHDNSLYEFQVSVKYNASTNQFSAAVAACAGNTELAVYNVSQDLSDFLTNSMFVGFTALNGGVYNVSQWNFTSTAVPPSSSSVKSGGAGNVLLDPPSPGGSSTSKIRKGYVVGLSMMGLVIGALILVVGACWFRRRPRSMNTAGRVNDGASFGTDPAIAMATTDFKSVPDPKRFKQPEYTLPLNPMAGRADSASSQGSGTASWLKPGSLTAR